MPTTSQLGEIDQAQFLPEWQNLPPIEEIKALIARQAVIPVQYQSGENGEWVDALVTQVEGETLRLQVTGTEMPTQESDLTKIHLIGLDAIPENKQESWQDICEWVAQYSHETPEELKDILEKAISYLKLVPQAKQCLWAVIKVWVKDSFWQLFPGYYQALSPP
ncbi:MAG: hypothetical protein AB4426_26255 [Xenococcaceae cyanobacterium]